MTDYNFRPQILVFFNIKEYIVSPYMEALDGRKSSKYFNGCVKISDVKKHIKEHIVSPYMEDLDGRKSSKYFNGCVKISDVKKHTI